jgi:hypothetical protein
MPDKSPRGEIGHRIDSSSMHFLSQLQGFVSDPFVIESRNIFCVVLFHSLYKKVADQGEGYLQVFTTWYEELLRSNKYLFSASSCPCMRSIVVDYAAITSTLNLTSHPLPQIASKYVSSASNSS